MSYNTLTTANDYFATRLHTVLWDQANDSTKQKALNDAARIIDHFAYIGSKTVSTQASEWPRSGIINVDELVVPTPILEAECDIAYALLSGYDPEEDTRSLMVTSRGYSSVRITYDPKLISEWLYYGVPSQSAWANLVPYFLRDTSGSIKLHRVS